MSLRDKNAAFEGVMTPLYMPLDDRERVIERDLARHVADLLGRGVRGFLVPSGTGEFYNLTPEERSHAVRVVSDEVKGRALVVSLASECGTRNTLRRIAEAREAGADGAMAVPPYFSSIGQDELKEFFEDLANEGGLPLWLYHQPTHTKITIEPATVGQLVGNPNIVGIKASAWVDILYFQQVLREVRDRPSFRVLMGEDINQLSGLIMGGHGTVSTLSNIIPDELVSICAAIKRGDIESARRLQDRITQIDALLSECHSAQGAAKYILKKRGIFTETRVSKPSNQLSTADVERLESEGRSLALF